MLSYEENNVLFQIFATQTIQEGNKFTVTGKKIDCGQIGSMAPVDTENDKKALHPGLRGKLATYSVSRPKKL